MLCIYGGMMSSAGAWGVQCLVLLFLLHQLLPLLSHLEAHLRWTKRENEVALYFAVVKINKPKKMTLFPKATKNFIYKTNKNKQKQKSFVCKTNINKQKQRASFTEPTWKNRNKELGLQSKHKQTGTKSFVYKTNRKKSFVYSYTQNETYLYVPP